MNIPSALPPHHRPFAADYVAGGEWSAAPFIEALPYWAAHTPDVVALTDDVGCLTYGELATMVRRAAAGLRALGVGPGDGVALQLPNCREFVIFQQAAINLGAFYVPLVPQLRDNEMAYALSTTRPRAVVVPGDGEALIMSR